MGVFAKFQGADFSINRLDCWRWTNRVASPFVGAFMHLKLTAARDRKKRSRGVLLTAGCEFDKGLSPMSPISNLPEAHCLGLAVSRQIDPNSH